MNSKFYPIITAVVFIVIVVFIVGFFDLYEAIPYLDKIFHFLGGAIAGWVGVELYRSKKESLGSWIYFLSVISFAVSIGVLWEYAEYLSSVYSPDYFPSILKYFYGGGISDTLGDLVADTIGAILAVLPTLRSRAS